MHLPSFPVLKSLKMYILSASIYTLIGVALSSITPRDLPTWPIQTYKTANFTPPIFSVSKSGAPLAAGLIFITPASTSELAALITTDSGELIWNSPQELEYYNLNVQELDGERVLTYWVGSGSANTAVYGHGYGYVSILNTAYEEIYRVDPKLDIVAPGDGNLTSVLDLHESYVTPRGSLLVTAYNITGADLSAIGGSVEGWIYDCLFYEIDIKSGDILFRWSAYETGIPITATKQPLNLSAITSTNGTVIPAGTRENPHDCFHINAVQSVGSSYLVNSRNTWTTFLVDSNGSIEWRFEVSLPFQNLSPMEVLLTSSIGFNRWRFLPAS